MTRQTDRGHRLNQAGLVLSTIYLGWSLVAKVYVQDSVVSALNAQNISYQRVFTTPTPFNTVLWRAVAMDGDNYYEAYYSLLDGDNSIDLLYHLAAS